MRVDRLTDIKQTSSLGVLLAAALACFIALESGFLGDAMRLGSRCAPVLLAAFSLGFLAVFMIARYSAFGAALAKRRRFCVVLLIASAVCGAVFAWLLLNEVTAAPGTILQAWPLALLTFITGAIGCMGMLRCYEGLAAVGAVIPKNLFVYSVLAGILLTVLVYWLESPARQVVFGQLNSLAFLLLLAAQQISRSQQGAAKEGVAGQGADGLTVAELGAAYLTAAELAAAEQGAAELAAAEQGAAEKGADGISLGTGPLPSTMPAAPSQPINLNRYTHLTMFAFQLTVGYCLGIAASQWQQFFFSSAALLTVALSLLYLLVSRRKALALGEIGRFTLPVCIIMLFAVLSQSALATAIVLSLAFAFFVLLSALNAFWLVRTAVGFSLDAARHVAAGKLPLALGMTSGVVLGITVQWLLAFLLDGTAGLALMLICSAIIASTVAVAYTLLPFNHGTPVKGGIIPGDFSGMAGPDGPSFKESAKGADAAGDSLGKRQGRPFRDYCNAYGKQFGLTARELEVLFLLACGYNTESIALILIVSASTSRTHVYRIYQKTGIHSQQELIRTLDHGYSESRSA